MNMFFLLSLNLLGFRWNSYVRSAYLKASIDFELENFIVYSPIHCYYLPFTQEWIEQLLLSYVNNSTSRNRSAIIRLLIYDRHK